MTEPLGIETGEPSQFIVQEQDIRRLLTAQEVQEMTMMNRVFYWHTRITDEYYRFGPICLDPEILFSMKMKVQLDLMEEISEALESLAETTNEDIVIGFINAWCPAASSANHSEI